MKKICTVFWAVCMVITLCSCKEKEQIDAVLPAVEKTMPIEQKTADKAEENSVERQEKIPSQTELLQVKKESTTRYEWDEQAAVLLVRGKNSWVTLEQESAAQYPELAEVLEQTAGMQKKALEEEFDNFVSSAREENPDEVEAYVSEAQQYVRRADSNVFSVLTDSLTSIPQMYRFRAFHGTNYDTKTGRELDIHDVIADMEKVPELVEEELTSQMWTGDFSNDSALEDYFAQRSEEDLNWTLDYNGVTFWFNPGDIAPAGLGNQMATLTFAEHPELFASEYMTVPESYYTAMPLHTSYFEDGEEWIVSGHYLEEELWYSSVGIYTANDSLEEEEYYSYGIYPYYVTDADGFEYLYLFCAQDEAQNPLMSLQHFWLKDGQIIKLDEEDEMFYDPENCLYQRLVTGSMPEPEQTKMVFPYAVPFEISIATHELEEWDEENRVCYVSWQSFKLGEEDALKYSGLAQKLDQMRMDAAVYAQEDMEYLLNSRADIPDNMDDAEGLFNQARYYVQRADDRILSALDDRAILAGGDIHSFYWASGVNLDPHTGEALTLEDVLTDTSQLPRLLADKLMEKYPDEINSDPAPHFEVYDSESYSWTLGYQGITFYFTPYEVASYAAGMLTVSIGFEEMPDLFNEYYNCIPAAGYSMAIPMEKTLDLCLEGGSQQKDSLTVAYEYDMYGSYKMMTVTVNDETFTEEIVYAYDFEPYLVCVGRPGAEKYYLYVISVTDNDYHMLNVYDLNGEDVFCAADLYNIQFMNEWVEGLEEYGTRYTKVFNTPDRFMMMTGMDLLGTLQAVRYYETDHATGIPEPQTDFFWIVDSPEWVSLIPLEGFDIVEGVWREIPAGSTFTMLRTDGETYMEMQADDGNVYKLNTNRTGWPWTVNGIAEEECFEGILYAG